MGERVIYDSGLDRMATVASIISDSAWHWPPSRSAALVDLAQSHLPSPSSLREDVLVWEDDRQGRFSVDSAWNALRSRRPEMPWSRVVWFRKAIPRHSFLLWMSIQGGLCTQDSLMKFGISSCSRCILCGCSSEDIDHLFFQCLFSSRVWSSVLTMCGLDWSCRDWCQTVEWLCQFSGASLFHLLVRLSFAASVYHIWRERNARTHDMPLRPVSVLLYDIVFDVRNRVSSLRKVNPSYDNKWLHLSWHLPDDIFS